MNNKIEKVLSLDVSSKTGFSVLSIGIAGECILEAYGQVPKIHCPDSETYPGSYVTWAYLIFNKIEELIEKYQPDTLVIEQTCAGSKNAMSQKILEFSHFLICKYIQETKIPNFWFLTGEWRKEIGSYMNKTEKSRNKEIKDYKDAYFKKYGKKTKCAYDINGKRMGKIGKKKVTIRLMNEVFKDQLKEPLRPKDEDASDALAINYCYYLKKQRGLYA